MHRCDAVAYWFAGVAASDLILQVDAGCAGGQYSRN